MYYGVWEDLLKPGSKYIFRLGWEVTFIAFHALVLMFVTYTVNARLGAGAITAQTTVTVATVAERNEPVVDPVSDSHRYPEVPRYPPIHSASIEDAIVVEAISVKVVGTNEPRER